jgi:hypothetical protein
VEVVLVENELIETQETDTQVSEVDGEASDANPQLRAYADRLKAENQVLRAKAMKAELGEIGLSPDEGLGVAIAESYKGDISAEAIAAYASEKYRYDSGLATTPPPAVVTGERLERLDAVSESVTPPPPEDVAGKIAAKVWEADATRKDAENSIAVKMGQFAREHYG